MQRWVSPPPTSSTSLRARPPSFPSPRRGAGPVAIVIDDLGRSLEVIDELRAYGVPLTYAVLPYETKTAAVAARLAELGEEVLCHLPMEPQSGENPGPGALTEAMTTRRAPRRDAAARSKRCPARWVSTTTWARRCRQIARR